MARKDRHSARMLLLLVAAALLLLAAAATAGAQEDAQSTDRFQALRAKALSPEGLSAEERTEFRRLRTEWLRQRKELMPGKPSVGLTPLNDMGEATYKNEDGGLYGGGSNVPPAAHAAAAAAASAQIVPLDAEGNPSPDGNIVLLSIGMSNTAQEFGHFKRLTDIDTDKSPRVTLLNGAQGGRTGSQWAVAEQDRQEQRPSPWAVLDQRLAAAGLTAQQVQVVWMKHAERQPAGLGEFPAHAQVLRDAIAGSIAIARKHFPNLKVAYLASRIYGGYAHTPLNPEPYAYESAFAVRWVILNQIAGEPALNHDPDKGEVKAPVILWGPYFWADGVTPRPADGLIWNEADLAGDGTHPGGKGRRKVAGMLMEFFKGDANARTWFLKQASPAPPVETAPPAGEAAPDADPAPENE